MRKSRQENTYNREAETIDDEIDLIDLLRVIWKRKYLILAGTVVAALVAVAISLSLPKVYRITMLIEPGLLALGENGPIYTDSSKSIKTLLNMGSFNEVVLNMVKATNNQISTSRLKFSASVPKNTGRVIIRYETPYPAEGLRILEFLIKAISKNYSELIDLYKDDYRNKIEKIKSEIRTLEAQEKNMQLRIQYVTNRLSGLERDLKIMDSNFEEAAQQRDLTLSVKKKDEHLTQNSSSFSLQQQLSLKNDYYKHMDYLKEKKETAKSDLMRIREEKIFKASQLIELERRKGNIKSINIIKHPQSSSHPIKPSTKFNIILGTIAGFMVMIFFSVVFECYSNKKK